MREIMRVRNLNPNGSFQDPAILDSFLPQVQELLNAYIELRRTHAVFVARGVEQANALSNLLQGGLVNTRK